MRPQAQMDAARILSPRRKTTDAQSVAELAQEQLLHFGIDPESEYGQALFHATESLYRVHSDVTALWRITEETIDALDPEDRVAYFNAKKFLSFQVAKILDTVQNPFRRTYQSLGFSGESLTAKGGYPLFDNVPAIFSANAVIARTATYVYACTEWVDDAFHGQEFIHSIYSRLFNPTSISLANQIVDLEAGKNASNYLAWNFSSGMAALDATFSNVLSRGDVVLASRNIYGGTYQLLEDFYARDDKFEIALEWFDGFTRQEFKPALDRGRAKHEDRLRDGGRIVVYLESPCNPHGYVLDVPGICRAAHEGDHVVILDSTIATPFLARPLRRADRAERPDYQIHSYTKDLTGTGNATAGVVIAENHLMFQPKGTESHGVSWDETMFWEVYYVKGAFLGPDAAFEVLSGMKSLDVRMLRKCINTEILARYLSSHPDIHVSCNVLEDDPNCELRENHLRLGLPAPLFTIDLESAELPSTTFTRFFDCLDPAFGHQVSLGQSNTVILCPAYTSHSELDEETLAEAGITPTTIRIAVGDEDPHDLIDHFRSASKLAIEPERPGFSDQFPSLDETREMARSIYVDVHSRYAEHLSSRRASEEGARHAG